MKILIATDSFKDCLSARMVGEHLKKGLLNVSSEIDVKVIPVGDGGEGTVEALIDASKGKMVTCKVMDPLFREIDVNYGIIENEDTAIIEMAAASGIELLQPEERNPWKTSTFGTGQLIIDALDRGCRRFICGIGGSATNDGGIGMAAALGVKFKNKENQEISPTGGELKNIEKIITNGLDPRIPECEFIIACDVDNPLIGDKGASKIYAPQKGADENMVNLLDNGLRHFSDKVKEYLNIEIESLPGAGAAGGLGAGFVAFLGGKLKKGIDIVIEETKLETYCRWCDYVITGEGKIDHQTKFGKTPQGVANIAMQYNVPVIAVAGTLGKNYHELYNTGFNIILSIVDKPMNLEEAIKKAPELLENAGFTIAKMLTMNKPGFEL